MHRQNVKNHPIGDYYVFPGGGREGDETFEDGAIREIKEEFGIDVKVVKELKKTNKILKIIIAVMTILFAMTIL